MRIRWDWIRDACVGLSVGLSAVNACLRGRLLFFFSFFFSFSPSLGEREEPRTSGYVCLFEFIL
jgi:hypothetical protein